MSSSSPAPTGEYKDDSYANNPRDGAIPVVKDADMEDTIDAATADSDAQLERDEADAIDRSNIVDERTRGAAKKAGTYTEPGDEEVSFVFFPEGGWSC